MLWIIYDYIKTYKLYKRVCSENELELYVKQDDIFTPEVVEEFKKAGMLREFWQEFGIKMAWQE